MVSSDFPSHNPLSSLNCFCFIPEPLIQLSLSVSLGFLMFLSPYLASPIFVFLFCCSDNLNPYITFLILYQLIIKIYLDFFGVNLPTF